LVRKNFFANPLKGFFTFGTGVRMFFWTVRRPVQGFCGIARGSSSPVTS
jgi:hypothetical protein